MATKRKRRFLHEGLPAGERLKRHKLATDVDRDTPWGWVGTSVKDASNITHEHLLSTCGFSNRSNHMFCANKYRRRQAETARAAVDGELADDVIVISEDETPLCSKRSCAQNPNCLNYLGQEKWEDEEDALNAYMTAANLGRDPRFQNRKTDLPVGLRNLGATCYANAYIQVWFQDIPFRNGVYQCQPSQDKEHSFEESPIYQLQATFAALQESKTKVFNPIKLVESLKLRTNEQQDAQEFSKLFMSHLDTEFQKQSDPVLKQLLSDQFQGKQAYATTCLRCGNCSENESDFLEIEVNLENNASLESRIQAVLEPEILSGDNKYRCSLCDSLEDAKRQLVLRRLPPVLHFSLLRFVFDIASMERKKSKHNIVFPTSLDMGQFLGEEGNGNIYDLQGILMHKGSSAYHGHYEAMVFDRAQDQWFIFNDEVVTKMKAPGTGTQDADDEKAMPGKPRPTAKKRRRVEDSDDEIADAESLSSSQKPKAVMSSKDAYMLVYTRREASHGSPAQLAKPPPQRAAEAVQQLNGAHEDACNAFYESQNAAREEFQALRQKMTDVYRSWQVSSNDEKALVVSQHALKTFLSRPFTKVSEDVPTKARNTPESEEGVVVDGDQPVAGSSGMQPMASSSRRNDIVIDEVVCTHGQLDPSKCADMKRISYAAYQRIMTDIECRFVPELTPDDVCRTCVVETFSEKLYQHEHPIHVSQFENVADKKEFKCFWISKAWLKDWKQAKPKMHVPSVPDPPPDSDPYRSQVECEHGGLSHNLTGRQRISEEAYALLKSLFPAWKTISDDFTPCAVCDAAIQMSRDDHRELRKRAEDEKAKLKHMHENAHNGNTVLLEDVPCALVSSSFVRMWKMWILRPNVHPRPQKLDNSPYICEHGLLSLDPNSDDLDKSVCLVRVQDWFLLQKLYAAGPFIAIENRSFDEDGMLRTRFVHEPAVCNECRTKRKSDYDMTEITVRTLSREDPDPTPGTLTRSNTLTKEFSVPKIDGRQTSIITYRDRATGPKRQSKRIRTLAKRKEITLGISKEMTVKGIKLLLQQELDVPTICQRLFYKGYELQDNEATVASLEILANDVLEFREEQENEDLLEDSDVEHASRKREADGGGFGGTLLGGDGTSDSMLEDTTSERSSSPVDTSVSCPACTFKNGAGASACEICDTRF